MKFHKITEDILSSKVKNRILQFILKDPYKRFSGRELASLLGMSSSRVHEVLRLFEKYGILKKTRIGRTDEWETNHFHYIVNYLRSPVYPICEIDERAFEDLQNDIKREFSETDVCKIVIFGSIARGTEKPNSDIDLFIVVKEEEDKEKIMDVVNKLSERCVERYGNAVSPVIYTEKELDEKREKKLIQDIERHGITIR